MAKRKDGLPHFLVLH